MKLNHFQKLRNLCFILSIVGVHGKAKYDMFFKTIVKTQLCAWKRGRFCAQQPSKRLQVKKRNTFAWFSNTLVIQSKCEKRNNVINPPPFCNYRLHICRLSLIDFDQIWRFFVSKQLITLTSHFEETFSMILVWKKRL